MQAFASTTNEAVSTTVINSGFMVHYTSMEHIDNKNKTASCVPTEYNNHLTLPCQPAPVNGADHVCESQEMVVVNNLYRTLAAFDRFAGAGKVIIRIIPGHYPPSPACQPG
jgi:hypothetical protein